MSWTRRRLLQATATTVMAVQHPFRAPSVASTFVPQCGLAPNDPGLGPLDVHAHIFNATDLQVERFLRRAVAPSRHVLLRPVIYALGPVLQAAGWAKAPTGREELAVLEQFDQKMHGPLDADAVRRRVDADRAKGLERYADAFAAQLQTPIGKRFLNEYQGYVDARVAQRAAPESRRAVTALRADALAEPEALIAHLETERALKLDGIFDFVSRFFQFRYVNAVYLLENYGCRNTLVPSRGPGVYCCLMVDYDYGLDAGRFPTPTPLDDQIAVMRRIAALSDGRILPFVAFDPWRHVYEGPSALTRVVDAVGNGAFGVKLYPPMGFAPAGNDALRPRPRWPRDFPDFGKRLDESMKEFLGWCAGNEVPVLAHGNRSNAAHKTFLDLGGPAAWRRALNGHPGLRVCFGHFGDEHLLDAPDGDPGWSRGFLEAFGMPQGKNAYGDWSYFSGVLDDDERVRLVARARALFETGAPIAQDRILYGSDWSMIAMEENSELYYRDFELVMQELERDFPGLSGRFFVTNAAEYLGLGPNGPTRRRMEKFFDGGQPRWLGDSLLTR